ncbi:ABC transporter ATP-binding protein [Natronococcus sp. JC468]|uniref:ABC transporter ATP-binding protein n=1 Tax=Natronococcus sp. JC468 TaxID=1961921 RepID=UPI00143ADE49|nr:ABC transporter ATP-binding protein [Natronococcus sp. JC468]NKE37479.1 ABC transporter ATP-binding protein [Natronococcus sp. JC468]
MGSPSPSHKKSDTSSPIVTATDVRKVYSQGSDPGRIARALGRSKPPTISAVDTVSLEISTGEVVGLAGPSGSGKSTLLHILAGLEQPTEGTVTFQGTELSALSRRERTRHRLEHIGIVFQHFHLLNSLSARANVALPLVELGVAKRQRRQRATELLERVGLGDRITHRPGELSGGEQQRVAIARALITDPELVIADEPTGELDTDTGRTILQEFTRVAENRAVVLASHDRETLDICDRLFRLRDGAIASQTRQGEITP